MSWDTEFEELMAQTVTRNPYAGQDEYGQPTFGAFETVACRVVYRPEIVRRTGAGEASGAMSETVARARIYCAGIVGWGLRDQITLPDGTMPEILEVRSYPDEDGNHHEVVIV